MPRNIVLDEEAVEILEQGGGLKADTVKTREQHYKHLEAYVLEAEPNRTIEALLHTEEGRGRLEELIGLFFYSLRVTAKDDGSEKLPKRGYALKIRSNLKCYILENFRVDITDASLFPNSSKKWKSFMNELVANNRSETEHHQEIDPVTMVGLTQLIIDVVDALQARGTEKYQEKLSKIPFEWQDKLNRILQDGVQLILTLFEVRRGKEGLEFLKKNDFVIFEDSVFDFKYIRKILSEAEKNQPEGSNSYCHGVIPFKILTGSFNPGEVVSFYLSLLPEGDDGALFPQSRDKSKKFNPHSKSDMMYETKRTVGKNKFSEMLPTLCEIIGRPRQTNHCIRSTAICYMRRAGMSWETIIKVTGHRSTVTLVKNYDLKLEAPGLHEISHATGTGQVVAMGERADLVRLEPRRKRLNMVTCDGVVTLDDSPTPKANKPADDGHVSAGSDSLAPNTMVPGSRSMLRPVSSSSGMPGMINSSTGVPGMISSSTMGVPGMMNSSSTMGVPGMMNSSSTGVPGMISSSTMGVPGMMNSSSTMGVPGMMNSSYMGVPGMMNSPYMSVPGMMNSSSMGVPGMMNSSMGVPGMMSSSSGISGIVSSSMRVPEMNSSGSSRYEDPSFILMESAGRFVGSLGKSIMEGAAPMLENLLRANREQHMQVMVQRGNMEIEKVEVKTITKPN